MFSYALSTASTYFYLPIDDEEDADVEAYERKCLTWIAESTSLSAAIHSPASLESESQRRASDIYADKASVVNEILQINDLYGVLGISKSFSIDRVTLRRAYLSRSRACHPDKFQNSPDATRAFQKVAQAYDILSKPASKRLYDNRSPSDTYDDFAARPPNYAEETFRGVVIGIFNDFLDGDLEVIRTLLKAINEINPSIKLDEGGIDTVLTALEAVRERALTCRTCIFTLHTELTRLFEVQDAFRALPYLDITGRTRLTIQFTRIMISLPITLERALCEQNPPSDSQQATPIFPRHVTFLVRSIDIVLNRLECILK